MKLCKDCKWCEKGPLSGDDIRECLSPKVKKKRWWVEYRPMFCGTHRDNGIGWLFSILGGYCGKRGRFFEPK